ncbi:MAG: DUF1543 domain-containing protein [Candidatus Pacebacteria bacterium]|nr:DUF1543 domain-containing protein [Candidatus Paceibacterota bacterium]
MNNPKLFMLMLGCKPPGRYIEQHDILFTIAPDFASTETDAKAFWKEAEKIHIDAWKNVTQVDGYKVSVVPKRFIKENDSKKLFFINLGGYKEGEFDEFHYKVLVVAENISEAQKKAKDSVFCLHHPGISKQSLPHIDDKYGVDVEEDETYEVKEILPVYLKEEYSILIEDILFDKQILEDEIHLGYQRYEKMKK